MRIRQKRKKNEIDFYSFCNFNIWKMFFNNLVFLDQLKLLYCRLCNVTINVTLFTIFWQGNYVNTKWWNIEKPLRMLAKEDLL